MQKVLPASGQFDGVSFKWWVIFHPHYTVLELVESKTEVRSMNKEEA